MEKAKFKPAQQEEVDGKVECYWCEKSFTKEEMTESRQYGVVVWTCKGCNQP